MRYITMKAIPQLAFFALPALAKSILPLGTVLVPLIRIRNDSSGHGAVFNIGTPPQPNVILLDTGSFSFCFENPSSFLCNQADNPCGSYGSYNNLTSSTAVFTTDVFNDGVQDMGYGPIINDTVILPDNQPFESMMVGHLDNFGTSHALRAPQTGFLGMRAHCRDADCTNSDGNFLRQLYDRGDISKHAYSIYLGPESPAAHGAMIIGGVDVAKQASDFVTIPMADVGNYSLSSNSTNLIFQSSISITLQGSNSTAAVNTTKFALAEVDKRVLIDTGNVRWTMPYAVFWNGVAPFFGIVNTPTATAPFPVDCAYRNSSRINTINVYFNNDLDLISIPLAGLVTQYATGQCVVWADGQSGVLGAAFLRNVLSVYDNEAHEVRFSQVRHTDEENIVAL